MSRSSAPEIDEILVLHHSHLDVGYTHSQPILWQLQTDFITEAIDWLEATAQLAGGARPKWTCEATEPVLRWLRKASSTDVSRFVALCREGRIGLAALRWHVSALVDRDGLKRLLRGKNELESLIGQPIRVACQHDVNGIAWPIVDELLDAGVDLFVMGINIHLGQAVRPRPGMFDWQAPSGRTLRVFNGNHYTMFDQLFNAWDDSTEQMAQGWKNYTQHLEKINYRLPFVYLTSTCSPIMWDNAPPNPYLPDLVQRWNDEAKGPPIRYVTFDDLRERVQRIQPSEIPTLRGDWTDYWSFGYGSMPVVTAVNQRSKPLLAAAVVIDQQPDLTARAAECIDLFDEHTYSYFNTSLGNQQAQAIESMKQATAHEGHELSSLALMNALERLAQNPPAGKGFSAVLVCNPTRYPRTSAVELPTTWFDAPTPATERTYRASRMGYESRPWRIRGVEESARTVGPVHLPAMSWQVLDLAELTPADFPGQPTHQTIEQGVTSRTINFGPATNITTLTSRIESPFHCLRYDPKSGRIESLVDRTLNREILCSRPGIDLMSFVRERPDPLVDGTRRAFYQRNLDQEKFDESCWREWTRVLEHAVRVTSCSIDERPGLIRLTRHFDAPGAVGLAQRITLRADNPVIEFEIDLELSPHAAPQGIYFALPLALSAQWGAAFDTAGQYIRLDDDQLPGASRGWVTAASTAVIWDENMAVALLTPDVPMVQFGGFNFGPPIDAVPRPANPLLLSWAANNYWDTNFPQIQPGRITLRYGLLTLAEPDFAAIEQHSTALRNPLLWWPVTAGGRAPSSGSLGAGQ